MIGRNIVFVISGVIVMMCIVGVANAAPSREECMRSAARIYKIPDADLLRAIAKHESSFTADLVHHNPNGSIDYGEMQINSIHLPALLKAGFKKEDLFNYCASYHIGAYILSKCIKRFGSTWRAVGAYNAGYRKNRESARRKYVRYIKAKYLAIKAKSKKSGRDEV